MNDNATSTAVVIVGAGPVGLALANELGYRGVPYVLLERGHGEVPFPAGEGMFSRTMEHLRRWGIADKARHHPGFPDDRPFNIGFATSVTGRLLALIENPSNADMPRLSAESPEGVCICPKMLFDPVLREGAAEKGGGELRYGHELVGFTQDERGVSVRVSDLATSREYTLQADYLAGCDGARSLVRKTLGISYTGSFGQGHNFAVFFKAPGLSGLLERQFGGPLFQLQTVNTPHRPYFTTVNGGDLWRMSMYVDKDESPDPSEAVAAAIGVPLDFEVIRAQPWAGHRIVAERYGHGRAFLLGDAAHLRWPKGGFGANTGIGDAVDLGWKIAAVREGWGDPRLLSTYEVERRPVAIRNVNEAANNRTLDAAIQADPLLDDDSPQGAQARRSIENKIHALRLREFRTQGIQLGYRYHGSPVCIPDGSLEPPNDHMIYVPTTWPGSRAPHAWMADGRSTLDLYGRGFVLVRFDGGLAPTSLADAAKRRGMPLQEVPIADDKIQALYERRFVLVRPDGHVAWRGDELPPDPSSVIDTVRGAVVA